jgi:hypothetical protein
MEYLGHTVNFKTSKKSYKSKVKILNTSKDWLVFKNTHEAILMRALGKQCRKSEMASEDHHD